MTSQGWVEAKFLNEGDNVISTPDAERMSIEINPHTDNVPTIIDEVIRSFRKRIGVKSVVMPHSAENFHGDGKGGDVNIVFPESLLPGDVDSFFFEPKSQNFLIDRSMSLSSLSAFRTFYQLIIRNFSSFDSIMSGLGISDVFGRTSICHHQSVSVDNSANSDIIFNQDASDDITRNFENTRELVFRIAGQISLFDNLDRQFNLITASNHTFSLQGSLERGARDVEFCNSFTERHSANVSIDSIVKITHKFYQGKVYNLETSTGYYIANNIITHNCRCVLRPYFYTDNVERQTGKQYFESLSDAEKEQILGKDALAAYKNGDIKDLKEFVGWKNDKRFGRSVYRRPLAQVLADNGTIVKTVELPKNIKADISSTAKI
jgi:hypothetical protein